MLTRPVQACSTASGAHRSECVPTSDHAAYEAACTRAWACMVSITLGAVTPGSERADAVEPDPMPRSNDVTQTGTAGTRRQMLAANPANLAFVRGRSKHRRAAWGGLLGALQPACCSTACSQALRSPPARTAVIVSDQSAA